MIRGRAGALVASALIAIGCGRRAAGPAPGKDAAVDAAVAPPRATIAVLDNVAVELHGRAERVIDPRALGRSVARCLIESGAPLVALAEQAPADEVARHLALTVDVAVHEPDAGQVELGVTIDAASRWRDDPVAPAPTAILTGAATPRTGAPADVDAADAAVAAVVLELEPRVCTELGVALGIWATEDLRPALAAADPDQVRWALQVLAGRPPGQAELERVALINAIAPHLGDAPPVRDAAIAALAATGDPRAVAPLTAITDVGDEATLVRIIEAVARLGGDDARDYLQVLTSHRDGKVARAARFGLAALDLVAP